MAQAAEATVEIKAALIKKARIRMEAERIPEEPMGKIKIQTEIIKIPMQVIRIQSLHLLEMAEVSPHQDRRKRNPSATYTNGSSHRRKENRL